MNDDLVNQLRLMGDRASYSPHMYHTAADRIEALTAEVDRLLGVIEDQAKLLDVITKEKELLEIEKDLLQRELVIANADCDKLRREILHDSWPCWVERPSSKTGGAP